MRITSVDVWEVVVPTVPGTVHSPEFGPAGWDEVSKHIIQLHTDEGLTGIGETYRGVARSDVDVCAAQLLGQDPLRLPLQYLLQTSPRSEARRQGRPWEVLHAQPNPAHDAYEMALYDLVGKRLDVPAASLLGGPFRTRVPADYWIGQQTPADAARNARVGQGRGFPGLKMKCTLDDPWEERVQAILDACGPDFKLTIDPNERFYRLPEFLDLARRLERFPNIFVYEDPLPKWHLDWYRQARARLQTPLALHLSDPRDLINAIKAEACDYLNLGGGMGRFVRNAALAEAAGITCWHGSGNDLGIAEHAYLHAAAAARNCVLPSDFVGSWSRSDDLILEPLRFEAGAAILPARPGLGCELDLAAVERHRVA